MITAAAASGATSGSVQVSLSLLVAIMSFSMISASTFAVWLVRQISALSKNQAETAIVLKYMQEKNVAADAKISALEQAARPWPHWQQSHDPQNPQGAPS